MAALESVYTAVIATVGGATGITILRYFNFFRKNKVEDRTTETERLEAENKRANERADQEEAKRKRVEAESEAKVAKAEADELAMLKALQTVRQKLFDEEEYVSRLRAQFFELKITPVERGK